MPARRHRLVTELNRHLEAAGFWAVSGSMSPRNIVAGVSGGPDSLALLLGLKALSRRRDRRNAGLQVFAAHVHHHLRESADADQRHVVAICNRFNIPVFVKDVEPGKLKGNGSANARRLRYEALREVAEERAAGWIATAHHAEDQLETMLMAMCRGAGLTGLSGMGLVTPLNESVRLIRPLLHLQKSDCHSMCRAAGVEWRVDPSNVDVHRVRARLRRDVIPVLDELWPGAVERASATAKMLTGAMGLIDAHVERSFGESCTNSWARSSLVNEPAVVVAHGLRRAALSMNPMLHDSLGSAQIGPAVNAIRSADRRPRRFDWPGGLRLEVTARLVRLTHAANRNQRSHG